MKEIDEIKVILKENAELIKKIEALLAKKDPPKTP